MGPLARRDAARHILDNGGSHELVRDVTATQASSNRLNEQIGARAFAQGNDIHLAPAQDSHLPHEAWHVVQQAQGRVKPSIEM